MIMRKHTADNSKFIVQQNLADRHLTVAELKTTTTTTTTTTKNKKQKKKNKKKKKTTTKKQLKDDENLSAGKPIP